MACPHLEYEKSNESRRQRRWIIRGLIAFSALYALLYLLPVAGSKLFNWRLDYSDAQRIRALATTSLPAGLLMFESDPADSLRLRTADPHYQRVAYSVPRFPEDPDAALMQDVTTVARSPTVQPLHANDGSACGYVFTNPTGRPQDDLFCHARSLADGTTFCVELMYDAVSFSEDDRLIILSAGMRYVPKWWWQIRPAKDGQCLYIPLRRADHLRLFAGEPNPVDAARFSVPYEWNGVRGEIECTLTSANDITLKIAGGPMIGAPEPDWKARTKRGAMRSPATTQPAVNNIN